MVNEESGYLTGPNSDPLAQKEKLRKERSEKLKALKLRRKEAGVSDDAPLKGKGGPNDVRSRQYIRLNQSNPSPKKSDAQSKTQTMNNSTYTTYANIAYIISEAAKSNLEEAKKPKEERLPVGKTTHDPVTILTRKTPSGSKGGQNGRTTQDVQIDADPTRPNKNAQAELKKRLKTNTNIRKNSGPHDGTPSEVATGKGNKAKRRVLAMESDVYFHLGQIFLEGGNPFTDNQRAAGSKARQASATRTRDGAEHSPTADREANRAASREPRDVKPTVTAKNRLARKRTERASKERKALLSVARKSQTPAEDK